MAYPYQIAGAGFALLYPHGAKPILRGSALYQVVTDTGSPDKIHVSKSTDAGLTWALQDSANAPDILAQSNYHHSIYDDGTRIWGAFRPSATTPPTESYLRAFNTSTDLWESAITGGPPGLRNTTAPVGANISNDGKLCLVVRSTGDKVLIYTDPVNVGGTNYQSLKFKVYSGGSWGSAVALALPGTSETATFSYCLMGAVLGASDRIHVFIGSLSNGYIYVTIKSDNTIANYRRWQQDDPPLVGIRDGLWGLPSLVTFGGNAFAALPIMAEAIASNNFRPGVLLVSDEDPPYMQRRDYIEESVPLVSSWISVALAQNASTGAAYLLWSYVDSGDESTQVRVSCSKGFAWSAPSILFESAAGDLIETVEASAANGTLRWVLENSDAAGTYQTPYYYEGAVTCAATGCPAAASQSPIYRVV